MTFSLRRRATERAHSAWGHLRRLGRHVLPRAVVLMYHRVAEPTVDPWDLCVSPSHFSEHLEHLHERGGVWSLSAYVERFRRGMPPHRAIILTFDDGYVDNLRTALPLLDAHDLPATFFVPTGPLGTDRSFWWDTLAACILHERPLPDPLVLEDPTAAHRSIRVSSETANDSESRRQVHQKLWNLLAHRRPEARQALLDQLCATTGTPADTPESRRLMTPNEVAEVAGHPDMEIGAHSVSHTPLPILSPEAQRNELRESRAILQDLTGAPVTGLSYPNGAYDATTKAAARTLGFTHACTTDENAVTWTADAMALPRLHVRDVDGGTLATWLAGILD